MFLVSLLTKCYQKCYHLIIWTVNNLKKRIEKLFNKKESRFVEVKTILNSVGYELERIRGSHHVFKNQDGEIIVFPVHGNLVKRCYVKEIIKKVNQSYDEKMSL